MDELNMNPGAAEAMDKPVATEAAEIGAAEDVGESATVEESSAEETSTPDETDVTA